MAIYNAIRRRIIRPSGFSSSRPAGRDNLVIPMSIRRRLVVVDDDDDVVVAVVGVVAIVVRRIPSPSSSSSGLVETLVHRNILLLDGKKKKKKLRKKFTNQKEKPQIQIDRYVYISPIPNQNPPF